MSIHKTVSLSSLWLVLLMVVTACVEPIDLNELSSAPTGRIVVEGLITNEAKAHLVRISRTDVPIPRSAPAGVSHARVSITEGRHTYLLHEIDTLPGTYATADTVQGEVGKTYTLRIEADGQLYTGSATLEAVTPFPSIEETFRTPNRVENPLPDNVDIYRIEFPKVRYGVAAPSRVVYRAQDAITQELLHVFYYEFPGIDPQGFLLNFQGQNARLILAEGSRIYQDKYSMTPENFAFIQAVYAQTVFKGGLFDRVSANAPSNLSNGALGFFAASQVISRSFVFRKDLLP
jgi:hypothetical protein